MTASPPHTNPLPDSAPILARVYALTDVGHTREHNEDTFVVADLEAGLTIDFDAAPLEMPVSPHGLLFLVADGMGGAASGELASSMAGDAVIDLLRERWIDVPPATPEAFAEALRDATDAANARIHRYARENPEHRGMGTTSTLAGLLGDRLFFAQVGDSRAYLVRDGHAQQLTKDQSLMQRLVEAGEMTPEEAEVSDRRNIILQALGPESQVSIDLTHQQIRRGDTLIMCSDGLSGLVRANEIAAIAGGDSDPRAICQQLIDRANELGGPDNITVIAARFEGPALEALQPDDAFGYSTYPLSGTMANDTTEEAIPVTPIRSDPTPRYGTPAPSRAAIDEEFERARAAETVPLVLPHVVQDRKRRSAPLRAILLVVAILVALWLIYGWIMA